ncbi:NAD(P)H-quinone oxidoreductase [Hoyosella rhizosphaerae]|uniref:Quinone oxidoreductase n=1 Tax=Hoyosella rhizosphaerae TaxID=1755582 RepID=A0A916UKK1_9ACTN|nr:NAD(P)H-quinone oxidoreductase [Hoyosella rhizosphaerae]MBN4925448.1 NAD(P)H-quinone oxidoreductase [Hoyosella rhizosphaerae]GGC75100.1 putative quinone oxidoreductase [Hoyosella rhizosphaerae]
MRAITMSQFGDPDVLRWDEVPDATPGRGEVLIHVAATAVNRADILQRQGHYPSPPGASPILGLECSGTIVELGEGVQGWSVGDEVCALLSGGGYAEYVAVSSTQLMPIPKGIDLHVAACLPEAACTVWSNLGMRAGMHRGQTLLIHGGASGIGSHAIQVARTMNVRVAVTAGSKEKLELCHELGARYVINYRQDDFVSEMARFTRDFTHPGADIILDIMGAKYLDRNLDVLGFDGHLIIIGLQGGRTAEIDLAKLLTKRASVTATNLRGRPTTGQSSKDEIIRDTVRHVWPMIEAGLVRPVVHEELAVSEAGRAHKLLDSGEVSGKLLLFVS